ncbi:MAG: hypothetical protein BJ554DRAFT_6389 [Olpidium bornovanus]|uniref:Uncharacterized protein n=1 Tax=Olpidium bornovanus TaxID=278681 RepID=A0A8H8DK10_9FUNG|nr:MAG: hypothetical protein BJ554DRAFT_6389 [Olpidium bornovanus]
MSADNHQQVQDADRVAAAAVPGERTSGTSAAAAADGVASTSIENQRRLRREARQKRILASGANRLNQITATFSGVQPPPAADAAAAPRDAEVPRAAATSAGEQRERGENEKDSKRAPPGNPRPEPSPSELYAQLAGLRRRFRDHDGDGDENEDEDGFGPDFSFARQNEGFEQMFAQNLPVAGPVGEIAGDATARTTERGEVEGRAPSQRAGACAVRRLRRVLHPDRRSIGGLEAVRVTCQASPRRRFPVGADIDSGAQMCFRGSDDPVLLDRCRLKKRDPFFCRF